LPRGPRRARKSPEALLIAMVVAIPANVAGNSALTSFGLISQSRRAVPFTTIDNLLLNSRILRIEYQRRIVRKVDYG
jgi:hypothetical protein